MRAVDQAGRRRILLAVEPRVLGEVLAAVLREDANAEVIDLRDAPRPAGDHFDAAIVTIDLTGSVDADVVIELPDHEVALRGSVTQGGEIDPVELDSLDALLALLDERLRRAGR